MRLSTLLLPVLLVGLAAPALARSTFPSQLDAACKAGGRTPPNPAALARATGVPYADCALCHTFDLSRGGLPSSSNINASGRAYKSGNLDPFCVLAPVNHPPVLAPIGNQTVAVAQPLGLVLTATDADGDPLAFSATGVPAGAVFMDAGNGMATFNWTPAQAGNYAVTFSVTDGMASDSEKVVITVGTVNAPPVLAPIGNQSVMVGGTLDLTISATDPEGGPLTFTATGLPAEASFQDLGNGSAQLLFMPSVAVQATVTVTVTDAGAPPESASETFTLTAQDTVSGGGPALDYATWDGWTGLLAVKGGGADAAQAVTILDGGSGTPLLVGRAGPTGRFRIAGRTFLAPCTVSAESASGAVGDAVPVISAAPGCGNQVLTRAKPRWSCSSGLLDVRGAQAPASANLSVVDAATGAMLVQGQADGRGRFDLQVFTTSHANIRLLVSSGSGNWTVGPVPVRGADATCTPGGGGQDN